MNPDCPCPQGPAFSYLSPQSSHKDPLSLKVKLDPCLYHLLAAIPSPPQPTWLGAPWSDNPSSLTSLDPFGVSPLVCTTLACLRLLSAPSLFQTTWFPGYNACWTEDQLVFQESWVELGDKENILFYSLSQISPLPGPQFPYLQQELFSQGFALASYELKFPER